MLALKSMSGVIGNVFRIISIADENEYARGVQVQTKHTIEPEIQGSNLFY